MNDLASKILANLAFNFSNKNDVLDEKAISTKARVIVIESAPDLRN